MSASLRVGETRRTRLGSIEGDSGSAHQEDLLEGDLGLGTASALWGGLTLQESSPSQVHQTLLP